MKIFNQVLASLLIGCNIFWLFAIPNVTQAAGGLGIMPKPIAGELNRSWFVYTLSPGESITDTVIINNHSDKPMNVAVESLDAANTTGGGFTLVKDMAANRDLGRWIGISSQVVRIAPNQSAEVGFKLTVPSDASVGQHSGAISVYEQVGTTLGQVGLKIRMGARVYVTVPGKVNRKLTFSKVEHKIEKGKLTFFVNAKNDSNINLEPALDIHLRGLFRNIVQSTNENGTYLPGSSLKLEIPWKKSAPKLGYYRVKLVFNTWTTDEVLADGTTKKLPNQTFVYQYSFWVGGRLLLILLAVLVLGWLGFRIAVYLLDKKKYRTKIDIYTVKPNEAIMHVAEAMNIFPQTITKFNRLTWPYTLNAGDKLMLPIGWLTSDELYQKQTTDPMPNFLSYLLSWQTSLYHPTSTNVKTAKVSTKTPPHHRLSSALARRKQPRRR